MQRSRVLLALAVILGSAVAGPVVPADAAVPAASPPVVGANPDFDGDGLPDIVVGRPGDPGQVLVRYGSGVEQTIDYDSFGDPTDSARLGQALLARDLNGDGYYDLAVAESSFFDRPGQVVLLFGGSDGLDPATARTVAPPTGATGFGWSIALLTSPQKLLVVGAERSGLKGGALAAYRLGSNGLPSAAPFWIGQSTAGVPGAAEAGDEFGAALAAAGSRLVVGVPGEDIGRKKDAGNVVYLTYRGGTTFTGVAYGQDSRGVAGSAHKDDRFGESLAIGHGLVAVGVPGDNRGAGSVQLFTIAGTRLKPKTSVTQNTRGVPGTAEAGDHFGGSVAIGRVCRGRVGIVTGATGEQLTAAAEGAAWVIPLTRTAACPAVRITDKSLGGSLHELGIYGQAVAMVRPRTGTTDTVIVGTSGMEDFSDLVVYAVNAPFRSVDVAWSYHSYAAYPEIGLSALG